jgi:hypothetical protein
MLTTKVTKVHKGKHIGRFFGPVKFEKAPGISVCCRVEVKALPETYLATFLCAIFKRDIIGMGGAGMGSATDLTSGNAREWRFAWR